MFAGDSWHVLQKSAGKNEAKNFIDDCVGESCGPVSDDLFIVLHVFCCSFCGCCCQTIVTTCRHSHELYVLSNTSAQISQGLKFAYSSKASRGIGEVGGVINDPLPYRIALVHQ